MSTSSWSYGLCFSYHIIIILAKGEVTKHPLYHHLEKGTKHYHKTRILPYGPAGQKAQHVLLEGPVWQFVFQVTEEHLHSIKVGTMERKAYHNLANMLNE